MKRKHIILLVAAAVILVPLLMWGIIATVFGGWLFGDTCTEIKKGFSDELLSVLDTQYQITIPDDAVFIKGINTNAFRDPMVVVLFEIPVEPYKKLSDPDRLCNYVIQKLHLDQELYTSGGADHEIKADWYEEMGGLFDYSITNRHNSFTFLSFELHDDRVLIRFVGHHPGATFS